MVPFICTFSALASVALRAVEADVLRFDLTDYRSLKLKLPEGYDQANVALEWKVARGESLKTILEVDLPAFAEVGNITHEVPAEMALLPLSFRCSSESSSESAIGRANQTFASFSSGNGGKAKLAVLLAFAFAVAGLCLGPNAYRLPRGAAVLSCFATVFCVLACVAAGTNEPSCAHIDGGTPTKLTLLVPSNQLAKISWCGHCPEEERRRQAMFVWRTPCDMDAFATALDAAANSCDMADCPGMPRCDTDGWCSGFDRLGCSISETLGAACIHYTFRTALEPKLTSAGAALLEQMLYCIETYRPVEGRPYTTDKEALLAPANVCSSQNTECTSRSSWSYLQPLLSSRAQAATDFVTLGSWTRELADRAAEEWLRHGQEEHASIASFSRFSMDLLRFAAPPHLVLAAHLAAADEVRHASKAFSLAVWFKGDPIASLSEETKSQNVEVGKFPVTTVELCPSLDVLTERTLIEGCWGEGAAVARLAFILANIVGQNSPAQALMEELLKDEARHAALAWATVRWAVQQGATPITLENRVPSNSTFQNNSDSLFLSDLMFTWAGRLPADVAQKTSFLVLQHWVIPWMNTGLPKSLEDLIIPKQALSQHGPLGLAVAEAAARVHAHLVQIETHEGFGDEISFPQKASPKAQV